MRWRSARCVPTRSPIRPDVKAKKGTAPAFTGEGFYSTTGDDQQLTTTVVSGTAATYTVRVQNDGSSTDSYKITAAGVAGTGWAGTVLYYQGLSGTTAVPATITSTGWIVGPLTAGTGVDFRIVVTPNASMPTVTPAYTITLTALSQGDTTTKDVMKFITSSTAARQPDMLIKKLADTADVGGNIYNTDGTNQTVTTLMPVGTNVAKYTLRIQNDGALADTFKISAPATTAAGWTVKYYEDAALTSDITTQVTGSGYLTSELAHYAYCPYIYLVVDGTGRTARTVAVGAGHRHLVGQYDEGCGQSDHLQNVAERCGGVPTGNAPVPT